LIKSIYVDHGCGADYTRIQDAIDNASGGDRIYVYSGIYNKNIMSQAKNSKIIISSFLEITLIDYLFDKKK
jgi:hypothetical protein